MVPALRLLFLSNALYIYHVLDSDVESPQKFRNRLLLESDNRDANDVKKLFEAYYWN